VEEKAIISSSNIRIRTAIITITLTRVWGEGNHKLWATHGKNSNNNYNANNYDN
jgi:hypothetical protein